MIRKLHAVAGALVVLFSYNYANRSVTGAGGAVSHVCSSAERTNCSFPTSRTLTGICRVVSAARMARGVSPAARAAADKRMSPLAWGLMSTCINPTVAGLMEFRLWLNFAM
jgi:hypothetical protein